MALMVLNARRSAACSFRCFSQPPIPLRLAKGAEMVQAPAEDATLVPNQQSTPRHFLTEQCQAAVNMLQQMTTPYTEGQAKTHDIIPRASIRNCKGLQILDLKLMGLGLSITRGSAFVIRKLGKLKGVTQWSAPCFLQYTNIGVGVTVGYDSIRTVVILGSDEVLDKEKGARNLFGVDFDFIIGKNSAVVQSDVSETQAIPYSLAGGALVDFSVKGGRVTVDRKTNQQLYGSSVLPEHILQGDVQPPSEMLPLYSALNSLAAEA